MEKVAKIKKKKKLGSYPYVSVVLSITFALFILGLFGLLIIHSDKLKDRITENIEIQVYLNKNLTNNQIVKINKTLGAKEFTFKKNGKPVLTFISKDEAAKEFIATTGEDFTEFLGDNPLRDAFTVKLYPEFLVDQKLSKVKKEIEEIEGVFEVIYMEKLINSINKNINKISMALIGFAAILIMIVVILINNTIKLALFSQRFLIRSMQLVGATASFIQKPFLFRAVFHGLLGAILATGLLWGTLQYANNKIEGLSELQDLQLMTILLVLLLITGGFIGLISTYKAISKYMKMSLDDLY